MGGRGTKIKMSVCEDSVEVWFLQKLTVEQFFKEILGNGVI